MLSDWVHAVTVPFLSLQGELGSRPCRPELSGPTPPRPALPWVAASSPSLGLPLLFNKRILQSSGSSPLCRGPWGGCSEPRLDPELLGKLRQGGGRAGATGHWAPPGLRGQEAPARLAPVRGCTVGGQRLTPLAWPPRVHGACSWGSAVHTQTPGGTAPSCRWGDLDLGRVIQTSVRPGDGSWSWLVPSGPSPLARPRCSTVDPWTHGELVSLLVRETEAQRAR